MVLWRNGHPDFAALRQRLHPAESRAPDPVDRYAHYLRRVRLSAEAVVGGVLGPLSAPHALVVGKIDGRGRLRIAGRTRPLPLSARAELAAVLTETTDEHPWPATIPASRFEQLGVDPVHYTRVSPDVVVELDVDTAFEHQRWRHPVSYQRIRADLRPTDLAPEFDSA